jgi:hypothetical protein
MLVCECATMGCHLHHGGGGVEVETETHVATERTVQMSKSLDRGQAQRTWHIDLRMLEPKYKSSFKVDSGGSDRIQAEARCHTRRVGGEHGYRQKHWIPYGDSVHDHSWEMRVFNIRRVKQASDDRASGPVFWACGEIQPRAPAAKCHRTIWWWKTI